MEVNPSRSGNAVKGQTSGQHPRERIGASLKGDVVEVGPGFQPFPTAPGARVRYADRPVDGGRDGNWPELAGAPWGPKAHVEVDLDTTGLSEIPDQSLDALIACHVIEHLANPVRALVEFERVLRPGGQLVLIVPDRKLTFDWVRKATTFQHLLAEYQSGVTEVAAEHIQEYCRSIYMQPPMHPALVRDWHDPTRLDADRMALHRRRSIHVHCWAPEDFACLLAGMAAEGLVSWQLTSLYFVEDLPDGKGIEFGLVLQRQTEQITPSSNASQFIQDWCELSATTTRAPASRIASFGRLIRRQLRGTLGAAQALDIPDKVMAQHRLRPGWQRPEALGLARWKLRARQVLRELAGFQRQA